MKRRFTPLEKAPSAKAGLKVKTGFTLLELLAVVVILSILATIVLPMFREAITRTEFKEVRALAELTRTAARYYDLKYGIGQLSAIAPQPERWRALRIDLPGDTKCTYEIQVEDGHRKLMVSSNGTWLYKYDFEWTTPYAGQPTQGVINSGNSDSKYVSDLPGL